MIPWLLIAVGGTMILSGVKETNPVALIKAILTGEPMPGGTSTDTTTGTTTGVPINTITGDPVVQTTKGTSDRSIAGQGTSTTKGTSDRSIEQSGQNAASAGWTSGGGGRF